MKQFYTFLLPFFISVLLEAQPNAPFIQNFTQKEYGKDINPETYCIAQDENSVIYAGTAKGIITYNGIDWGFIDLKLGGSYVASIAVESSQKIYVGAFNNFGYLLKNKKNEFQYISLSKSIKEQIGVIYKTYIIGKDVYFQGENTIYIYSNQKLLKLKPETTFHLSFPYKKGILVREREKGLYYVTSTKNTFLKGSQIFANTGIFGVLEGKDHTMFLTHENGIWNYNHSLGTFLYVNKSLQNTLSKAYGLTPINENEYIVNTLENGVFVLQNNKITANYSKKNGLKVNDIKEVIKDKFGNLWLATNNGISLINYSSPYSYYGENQGLTGDVQAISNNGKYVGTSDGFFYKEDGIFVKTDIHHQIWGLEFLNNFLFIATTEGLFKFDPLSKRTELILNGTFNSIKNIGSNLTIISGADGVLITTKNGSILKELKIPLIKTTSIEYDNINEEIWIGTQGVGVVRIFKDFSFDIYDDFDGLNIAWVNPILIDSAVYFGTAVGLEQFIREETVKKGLPDSLTNDPINYRGYFDVASLHKHSMSESINTLNKIGTKTFVNIKDHLAYFDHLNKDSLIKNIFNTIDFGRVNTMYSSNQNLFIGCSEGLIEVELNKLDNAFAPFNLQIEKITLTKDSLISIENYVEIDYNFNSISFNIVAPFYEGNHNVVFSYYLVGDEENWSEWDAENNINFNNLYEGNYTLKLKAKNIFNIETEVLEFHFTILPPWYRTIWAYFVYLIILVLFIYFIVQLSLARLKAKNEALEKIVTERTKEVVLQKEIIEDKHHEITSSINYAARIQSAVLTSDEYLNSMLSEYFVLFKPRDIVSGDFYWAYEASETKIIWVAADCTGHGVPGGFMSMLGMSFLNEIVIENKIYQPDLILNQLRTKIIQAFEKKSGETERKDGMDISLCVLDKTTLELQFAGAYNPLYIVREISDFSEEVKNEANYKFLEGGKWGLIELKASKMPVGKHILDKEPFELTTFQLRKNDRIYSFSDGFHDQFGGVDGKKYMSKNFKKTILSIQNSTMEEQKTKLNQNFITWMNIGNTHQIDDLCIMGVEI